jgi:hypothetical protein
MRGSRAFAGQKSRRRIQSSEDESSKLSGVHAPLSRACPLKKSVLANSKRQAREPYYIHALCANTRPLYLIKRKNEARALLMSLSQ